MYCGIETFQFDYNDDRDISLKHFLDKSIIQVHKTQMKSNKGLACT